MRSAHTSYHFASKTISAAAIRTRSLFFQPFFGTPAIRTKGIGQVSRLIKKERKISIFRRPFLCAAPGFGRFGTERRRPSKATLFKTTSSSSSCAGCCYTANTKNPPTHRTYKTRRKTTFPKFYQSEIAREDFRKFKLRSSSLSLSHTLTQLSSHPFSVGRSVHYRAWPPHAAAARCCFVRTEQNF